MAALVQSNPPLARHPLPQPFPMVRPSSSSAVPQSHHGQRVQPLYLVSAQQQMYMQQQSLVANYDYTRHQQSKQAQQRRQIPPQPNSAPPHPKHQQFPGRSRSDEALREKAQKQLQPSLPITSPQAQSAPRPQSTQAPVFRPALTPPPAVLREQPRPSSADGGRPASSMSSYRGRAYPEARYSSASVISRDNMFQLPPNIQTHPARYSAEDVNSLKDQAYQQYAAHGYPIQQPYARSPPQHHNQHIPGQIPAIQRRQSSLTSSPIQRLPRILSPQPQIKRASSSPELAPPQSPLHRKSSSSSSNNSAASAPSQLETSSASSTSSVPTPEQHTPFTPSPLGKPSVEPAVEVPPVEIPPETKGKSLSSRLRRALSFSSSSRLRPSISTPDLHAAAEGDEDVTDTISISSTASSASVMLRKMSSGLKKSRKSIAGIFKGGKRRDDEDKFPFGVPGEEASVAVCHATVEGEVTVSEGRRKSMVFSERGSKKSKKTKKLENVNLRGILKNSDSRQSSFESVPNGSTDSIVSVKVPSIATPPPPAPASDFATCLNSTLDSHFEDLTSSPRGSHFDALPFPHDPPQNYFDITPSTPQRQVVTAPATPTGHTTPRRGIQFSPRLEVHETWHSAEYDRRGEPATCNRLTAQLAQMIKEELNAYKMEEMIVHEESRSFTHFF